MSKQKENKKTFYFSVKGSVIHRYKNPSHMYQPITRGFTVPSQAGLLT